MEITYKNEYVVQKIPKIDLVALMLDHGVHLQKKGIDPLRIFELVLLGGRCHFQMQPLFLGDGWMAYLLDYWGIGIGALWGSSSQSLFP